MTRNKLIISFLSLCSLFVLLNCKKPEENFIPLTNPLDSCKITGNNSSPAIYDSINDLSFRLGPEWKINFDDKLKITVCIDTVASDQHRKVKTFVLNTVTSDLNLSDFFSQEVNTMLKDSVDILYLGRYTIDNAPALYAIVKTEADGIPTNNIFFFINHDSKTIIAQIGVSQSNQPIQEICSSMVFINSISFKVYSKSEVAMLCSQSHKL